MPFTIKRRGKRGIFQLGGTVRGRRIRKSTGSVEEARAREVAAVEESRAWRGRLYGERHPHAFDEAVAAYLAGRDRIGDTDHRAIRRLRDYFGSWTLDQMTQGALDGYMATRHAGARAAGRLRAVITPLTAVLRAAARRGWCDRPAFERPRQPPGRTRRLTRPEAAQLLAACPDGLYPLVAFLLNTGARLGEALALDWRDVDLTARRVTFLQTKNGTSRGVPLNVAAWSALANLPHRAGPVFDYRDRWAVYRNWRRAVATAGLVDLTVHDLRHTFASWIVQARVPLRTVAELLGHRGVAMVARYAHLDPDHLRSAVELIDATGTPTAQVGSRDR